MEDFKSILRQIENNDIFHKSLQISSCYIYPNTVEDWRALGLAIGRNTNLKEFSIGRWESSVHIPREQLAAFCDGGFVSNRSIERLTVDGFDTLDGEAFRLMAPFMENNKSLKELTINYCQFGRNDIEMLCLAMGKNSSLRMIDLSRNLIGDGDSVDLITTLGGISTLEELNLRVNNIHAEGCTALANLLQSNKSIFKLWLGWNLIDDGGAKSLSTGLKKNDTLKVLEISGNEELTEKGCEALTETLRLHNHTLERLYLNYIPGLPKLREQIHLLQFNKHEKEFVTLQKKLYYNFLTGECDGEPFTIKNNNFLLRILPYMIASIAGTDSSYLGRSKTYRHSALYHFVRNVPLLIAASREP